jgi:hypothetical protein
VSFRFVDRLPWELVAASGVIGSLVLVRYIETQLRRRRR